SSSTDSLCQMTPAIVPHLAEALCSSNPRVRIGVTTALAAYGQDAAPAGPRLTKALKDADIVVRIQAARALGRIKAELNIVAPALIEAFQDSASLPHQYGTTRVCTTAVEAVAELGRAGREAGPALLHHLKTGAPDMRASAARAIACTKGGDPDVVDAL